VTIVSIACNNPDNGIFMGRFDAMHYGDEQDVEITSKFWGSRAGFGVRYLEGETSDGQGRIRISRRVFRYKREKEWFGNWCWNALWMERREARRLLRYLRDSGKWHCEGGPTRLYHWFNDGSQNTSSEEP
jgi:hypothetical protein